MPVDLSIVMPVHNESGVIEKVVRDYAEMAGQHFSRDQFELLVVDDASTDETGEILAGLVRDLQGVRMLRMPSNRGHGPTVIHAVDQTTGEWVFHVDSDDQFVAEDFHALWEHRSDNDLVMGIRSERHDPFARRVLARFESVGISRLAGRRLRDPNVPFKLFRRALWEDVRPAMPASAFAPSLMLVVGASRRGWRIKEIGARHLARAHGRSSLHGFRLGRAVARATRETLAFRKGLEELSARESA